MCTSPQNNFNYKIDTFAVLRIDEKVSNSKEPRIWIGKALDVSNKQGEGFV